MKIIDLLNKIANGEEVPKKIKYDNQIYELTENKIDWYCYYYARNFLWNEISLQELNDEVEILEEEKEILEKLEILSDKEHYSNKILYGKINEIIDYLKSKGE